MVFCCKAFLAHWHNALKIGQNDSLRYFIGKILTRNSGDGEIGQEIVYIVLAENLSIVPITHVGWLTNAYKSSFRGSNILF